MDLKLYKTLKEKLVRAKNFTEIWGYFMDHFGDDPEFIKLGERATHPFLEAIVDQVGMQLFGRKVSMVNFLLKRLPDQQFLHGAGTLDGKIANVIYFEDIQMGLLAVVTSFNPSETKIIRFSGKIMQPANWNPSKN